MCPKMRCFPQNVPHFKQCPGSTLMNFTFKSKLYPDMAFGPHINPNLANISSTAINFLSNISYHPHPSYASRCIVLPNIEAHYLIMCCSSSHAGCSCPSHWQLLLILLNLLQKMSWLDKKYVLAGYSFSNAFQEIFLSTIISCQLKC